MQIAALIAFVAGLSAYGLFYRGRPAPEPRLQTVSVMKLATEPLPVSARECVNNLTAFGSRGPTGTYVGYAGLQSPDPRRMRLELTNGEVKLSLQSRGGETRNYEKKDLALFHFKGDGDSIVIRLPDKSFVYLKYTAQKNLEAYPQALEVLTGWKIRGKIISKIVLAESIHPSWPRPESLEEAMPADLPY